MSNKPTKKDDGEEAAEKKAAVTDKAKMKTLTANIPVDVESALKDAILATGLTQTEIVLEALRTKLPQIVREWSEKRAQAAQRFLNRNPNGGEGKGK